MKKTLLVFLFVIMIFSAPAMSSKVEADSRTVSSDFFDAYLDFSITSFQEVTDEGNLLYSPVSLYYVLAMLEVMTSNEALEELEVLVGVDKATLLDQIQLFTNDITVDSKDADFWFANSVFYDDHNRFLPTVPNFNVDTLELYQSYFDYDLQNLNFVDGSAASVLAEKITEGTDHFMEYSPDDFVFLSQVNFLIHNSIYYKGEWDKKYDVDDTHERDFNNLDDTTSTTMFMRKEDTGSKVYSSEYADAIKTYFLDGSSMIYILPGEGTDVNDLLANSDELNNILGNQDQFLPRTKKLIIPKMEMSSNLNLVENLENLGLNGIFTGQNNAFSDITSYPFGITDVLQMSKIEIDEEGVRVASTTLSIGCAAAAPPDEFIVDEPFIYVIMSATDIPLFIGIVYSL